MRPDPAFLGLFEHLHDGVLVMGMNRRTLFASQSYQNLVGYNADEVTTQGPGERVHPDDRLEMERTFQRAVAKPHSTQECSYRALGKDGGVIALRARGSYLPLGIPGWIDEPCVMVAVHDRRFEEAEKAAQEQLQASESFHRAMLECFDDVAALIDAEARIVWISPSVERVLSFKPSDLIGRDSFSLVLPEDRSRVKGVLERSLAGKAPSRETEFRLRDGMGRIRVVATISSPAGSLSGGALVVRLRDVTRVRLSDEELLRSERQGLVAEILAGLGHELRNPLMAISANTELLKTAALGPEDRESVAEIQAQVRRLRQLLDQAMSHPLDQTPEAVDAKALLDQALQQARRRFGPMAAQMRVSLETDPACAELRSQPGRLQLALANIILNAFQALPEGGQIRLSARPDHSGVLLTVEDNGPGAPQDLLEELFDPFYTTRTAAAGLGLSTSKRIVETHGGRLWAQPGEPGLIFHAWLPAEETA